MVVGVVMNQQTLGDKNPQDFWLWIGVEMMDREKEKVIMTVSVS